MFFVPALIVFLNAETMVFQDEAFPYRIVCKPEWTETLKNDSMLTLNNSDSGKKTRLQLKKYPIDSTYDTSTYEWSRLNYAINKELAIGFGKLLFVDTGATKKIGEYRAFEMFAFFSESTSTQTIWWAEYARWTEHDGFGYLVSIIGDTTEMRDNYIVYQSLMDSVSLGSLTTALLPGPAHRHRDAHSLPFLSNRQQKAAHLDLLGREVSSFSQRKNRLLVGKKLKRARIQ
jgi:hypothetical protein